MIDREPDAHTDPAPEPPRAEQLIPVPAPQRADARYPTDEDYIQALRRAISDANMRITALHGHLSAREADEHTAEELAATAQGHVNSLKAENETLRGEIELQRSTLHALQGRNENQDLEIEGLKRRQNATQADLNSALYTLEQFKEQVVEVALEVAREQDWCDEGLARTLAKLGLDLPTVEVFRRITVEIDVSAQVRRGRYGVPDLDFSEAAAALEISMPYPPDGWEDVEVGTVDVTGVESL